MNNPWSIEDDIRLFRWITDFKPAGVHKHFHMISILGRMNRPDQFPVVLLFDKLKSDGKSQFVADEVWAKLDQHYDLAKVDERENMLLNADENGEPHDEDNKEDDDQDHEKADFHHKSRFQALRRAFQKPREFTLPWDEYGELILGNAKSSMEEYQEDEEKGSEQEDADQEPSSKIHAETVQKERSPRRVTRSNATQRQPGRVTRSQGPAPASKSDEEKEGGKSDEGGGSESESEHDRDGTSSPQDESRLPSSDKEDQQDAEKTENLDSVAQDKTSSSPLVAEHGTSLPEGSPPSKRTRTTRSHPSDSIPETTDIGKDSVSMAPSAPPQPQPQTQHAVRTSSRVANRRRSRK
ncbi:LAFA_0E08724g1_1 [Lachancea sp. 'fantastica']|nr:LAFA_0E08724g1_1 [Lachancea sp. 'fantastica']